MHLTDNNGTIHFETPENIRVEYQLAGLGSRFVAFVFDSLLIGVSMFGVFVVLMLVTLAVGAFEDFFGSIADASEMILIVAVIIGGGFVNLLYFALFEWYRQGQTPGKKILRIRTVTVDGFSLSFTAVAIRNLFRLIDTIALFWVVPLVSGRSQRFGDIVAGTVVIAEGKTDRNSYHELLLRKDEAAIEYKFTADQLGKLTEKDHQAITKFLERVSDLEPEQTHLLAGTLVEGLTTRMGLTLNLSTNEKIKFLEDLITAELKKNA